MNFFVFLNFINCGPFIGSDKSVVNYLENFGYLPKDDKDNLNDNTVEKALMKLQVGTFKPLKQEFSDDIDLFVCFKLQTFANSAIFIFLIKCSSNFFILKLDFQPH